MSKLLMAFPFKISHCVSSVLPTWHLKVGHFPSFKSQSKLRVGRKGESSSRAIPKFERGNVGTTIVPSSKLGRTHRASHACWRSLIYFLVAVFSQSGKTR